MTCGSGRWAVGAVILAALSGCASAVYEGRYAWDEGWREAEVIRLGAASELGGRHFSDCRYKAPPGAAPADRYAVLSYRHMSRPRRAVVPVALGESLAQGEKVYVNVRDCSASTIARR